MLNKIIINNVQSHKNTVIDLVPGINVITGITDAGKSSILNAVYWALNNRPSSDGLRSHWDGECSSVELHFTDGIVIRKKSKTENVYILNGEKMLAGRNVPESVQAFLNCTDINFQDQFAPAFMLDWSPAERGIFLNKITNLQIIDTTITNIKKTIRGENNLIGSYELQLSEYKTQIKEYRNLDDLDDTVTALEEKQAEIEEYQSAIDTITDLLEKISNIDTAIKSNNKKLKLKKRVQVLDAKYKKLQEYQKKYTEIQEIVHAIYLCDSLIIDQKKIIKDSTAEFKRLMPDTCPLCER